MDTHKLDYVKVAPPEWFWDPHHQEDQGEEGPMRHLWIHNVVIIFLLISLLYSPPALSYFFLSLYLTFTVK